MWGIAMTHADLLAAIQIAYSKGDCRLLRANVGQGWTGKIISQTHGRIVLSPYRPFHGMPEGVLDLIGFQGSTFVAIDVKVGKDRIRPAQQVFIDTVNTAGGRAGAARTLQDAANILLPYGQREG
jgi:hypothetical protein